MAGVLFGFMGESLGGGGPAGVLPPSLAPFHSTSLTPPASRGERNGKEEGGNCGEKEAEYRPRPLSSSLVSVRVVEVTVVNVVVVGTQWEVRGRLCLRLNLLHSCIRIAYVPAPCGPTP